MDVYPSILVIRPKIPCNGDLAIIDRQIEWLKMQFTIAPVAFSLQLIEHVAFELPVGTSKIEVASESGFGVIGDRDLTAKISL